MDSLKDCSPGQAYNILKKMGAQPGEFDDQSNFDLASHANLSPKESVERIAEYFSAISQEFPPLTMEALPDRVRLKYMPG